MSTDATSVPASRQSDADLSSTHDYLPAHVDQNGRAALQAWSEYAELLELPFVPKTAAAEEGSRFTILRLGERTAESLNKPGTFEEQWVVLVAFEEDAILQPRNSKEAIAFGAGERALISTSKGAIRDKTANVMADILSRYGSLPCMRLVQLEPKQKGQSGAIIFRAAFDNEPA